MKRTIWLSLPVGMLLVASSARADTLLGTSVKGTLQYSGSSINYFDSSNGEVPASGYGNSSGTTVTIADPLVEFGAVGSMFGVKEDLDTANFTDTTLTISDKCLFDACVANNTFTMTFVDAAFSGLSVTQLSDSFGNGDTYSLVGDKLTVTVPGFPSSFPKGQTDSAVFNFASSSGGGQVPEPSSLAMLASGLIGLLGLSLKKLA
jgi:hypothetical protein